MTYKIPSRWTKDDFIYATWLAFIERGSEAGLCYSIIRDLQDCVCYGFSWVRSNGFHVDYNKYANEVANRGK